MMSSLSSRIEVTRNGSRSVLTACRSVAPLKLLNPAAQGDYCAVVLSSYGGGMVEGDATTLRVRCGEGAALYLGTQAFTKVYKSPNGIPCKQKIVGAVEGGGLAVVLPDPVVPYARSVFEQEQTWHLGSDACLVLADGHTAGRMAFGEYFAYKSYRSDITIHTAKRPILIERYFSEPGALSPAYTGAFGAYNVVFNIFVAGSSASFTYLVEDFSQTLAPLLKPSQHSLLLSFASPRPDLFVIRSLAQNVECLLPLYTALRSAIAHSDVLGADPLARKY